jgi:diguanylate cyclase (GGDEF)-like protein
VRAIGEMASRRWDRSQLAFAAALAVLLAASAAAVQLLDDLYLKPYSQQTQRAALRELALGAEQASHAYIRDQQAGLAQLCSEWSASPNRENSPANLAPSEGPKVLSVGGLAKKDIDAAWLTNGAGRVTAIWTRPLAGAGVMILAPEELTRLARALRRPDAAPTAGLCKLDGRLSFFACKDVKDDPGAADPSPTVWMVRIVDAGRWTKWGSAVGGKVEFAASGKGLGGVLFDEGGHPMIELGPDRKLALRWPLQAPTGEALGLLTCSMSAPPVQASAWTFRTTMLAVASGCLALALLAIVQSYVLIRRPLKRFLLRLQRLRVGEGTVDQLKEGLRGPSLALAEELGRAMTSLAQDCRADPMTGLANKRHFRQTLEAFYSQASRHGRPLAIMVMDVDHFKQVNDTLGHLQGDEVIRGVARTIGSSLRGADLAARLGGDEFAVLLPDTTAEQAAEVAERIRQRTLTVHAPASRAGAISMSIGVADLESGPVTCCEDLIELADKSLYAVKAQGRNKVLLAHTLHGDLQFSEIGA